MAQFLDYAPPPPDLGTHRRLRLFYVHLIASVAWFFVVESLDLIRGGQIRLDREGIQLLLSSVWIFLESFTEVVTHRWIDLACGLGAYATCAFLMSLVLRKRTI